MVCQQNLPCLSAEPVPAFTPPPWRGDLQGSRKVVLIKQGTIATDIKDLIKPAVEALREENYLLIALPVGPEQQDGLPPKRTDNGSQYEAGLFRENLQEMSVDHEFTHIASTQENCYNESFHAIAESAVCAKYEFESLQEAKETFNRFMNFYNQDRIHGSLGRVSANQFLQILESSRSLRFISQKKEKTMKENLK